MDRPKELLAELQRLARVSEVRGSLEAHLYELTSAAARLLGAESCTVLWGTVGKRRAFGRPCACRHPA